MNPDEFVTISRSVYVDLLDDQKKLMALENAGVDNWEWYDLAMEEYREDDE